MTEGQVGRGACPAVVASRRRASDVINTAPKFSPQGVNQARHRLGFETKRD